MSHNNDIFNKDNISWNYENHSGFIGGWNKKSNLSTRLSWNIIAMVKSL